jgi:hypothetical protein
VGLNPSAQPCGVAQVGLSHAAVLRHIVASACVRNNRHVPWATPAAAVAPRRPTVRVLFGGGTSERQVSLMSGTNVWLKLRDSTQVTPQAHPARSTPLPARPNRLPPRAQMTAEPYLLAPQPECGRDARELAVWRLPYAGVLRHTVEEVVAACERVLDPRVAKLAAAAAAHVRAALTLDDDDTPDDASAMTTRRRSVWGYWEEWMMDTRPQVRA